MVKGATSVLGVKGLINYEMTLFKRKIVEETMVFSGWNNWSREQVQYPLHFS